jgi:hypothetical protein
VDSFYASHNMLDAFKLQVQDTRTIFGDPALGIQKVYSIIYTWGPG